MQANNLNTLAFPPTRKLLTLVADKHAWLGPTQPAGRSYLITNATRVTSINVRVYGAPNEAVVEAGGGGGHLYDRLVRVGAVLVWLRASP